MSEGGGQREEALFCGGRTNLEDLEVSRVLAEAERVEAELARLAAVLEHVNGGDLALVGENLDEANGKGDLAEGLGRDLSRRWLVRIMELIWSIDCELGPGRSCHKRRRPS
jgi:hypothetical protein